MLQFTATLTQNIEAMTGSPVLVKITQVRAGSVVVGTRVVFLDANMTSVTTYQDALVSGYTAKIFGSSFGVVTVDPESVSITTVDNPSKPSIQAASVTAGLKGTRDCTSTCMRLVHLMLAPFSTSLTLHDLQTVLSASS